MRFITSFGDSGYDLYGEKFLKSFIRHWDAPLTVYYEEKRSFPKAKRVKYVPLFDVPHVEDYLKQEIVYKTKNNPDFRFQIFKFCRKSFVQIEEIKQGGKVFWLDADIETSQKANLNKIKRTLDNVCISYMGRRGFHPCTSFVGFNADHPEMIKFLAAYQDIYLSKEVFTLPEWHDAYVFNVIRERSGVPCNDIASHIQGKMQSFNVFNHCFSFARHKKGNRKHKECKKW